VIYDWRMNDKAVALSSRMPKAGQAARAPTASTPRKRIVCEANTVAPARPATAGGTGEG